MTRLGKHEKAVIKFLWEVLHMDIGERPVDYRKHRLFEDEYNELLQGVLLPIALVKKEVHVPHRSTMTRSLATLDEKGLIFRKKSEGWHVSDNSNIACGKYTKYIELTLEGQKVAQTLTNENVKC